MHPLSLYRGIALPDRGWLYSRRKSTRRLFPSFGRRTRSASREHRLDHFSVHIGQPEIPPLKTVREPFVIDAETLQDGRVEIVHVDRIADHIVAKVIRLSELDSRLDATPGKPD